MLNGSVLWLWLLLLPMPDYVCSTSLHHSLPIYENCILTIAHCNRPANVASNPLNILFIQIFFTPNISVNMFDFYSYRMCNVQFFFSYSLFISLIFVCVPSCLLFHPFLFMRKTFFSFYFFPFDIIFCRSYVYFICYMEKREYFILSIIYKIVLMLSV